MSTRSSRTRVKAAPPAALRQRPLTQASQSGQAVAKLWDQLASKTSILSAADADADKQDNSKSSNNMEAADAGVGDKESSSSSRPWSTPKGKRFRIPEIESCPPAPKKMRTSPPRKLKRSGPIAFFSPPESESSLYSWESSLLKTTSQ